MCECVFILFQPPFNPTVAMTLMLAFFLLCLNVSILKHNTCVKNYYYQINTTKGNFNISLENLHKKGYPGLSKET